MKMDDLYGKIAEELMDEDGIIDEESLHQWFKGGGWRQAGGKYDGKPCARQPGQKTTPKCVSRKKYSSMSKKERESAGRRKRKKDPGQTKKSGAAKPTYVKTDPQKGGRKKKKKNEDLYMDLEQIIQEELEAVLDEKKKKKGGKKDACYHKVKSRYKVWPSAYASGALVKCRKVGANNWGNSKKESIMIGFQNELLESKYSPHDMYDPKSGKKHDAKKEKDHLDMAKKGFVHVDPKKIEQILRDEGGAAGMDPFLKEFGEEMKDEIIKALEEMPNVGQHKDGDYILDDGEDVKISEGMNCGCGQDPCRTYGKNNSKIIAIVNEEIENYLEESLYYGLIDEEQAEREALLEKKKKKACKPRKGKKYAKRVGGKCKSYGAKGYKIAPGTSKGDSYCARSYGDMKSHGKDCSGKDRGTPLCLSRQKWKCSGKYSRKGK